MRVLVHDFGTFGFAAQLSRELARRGHEVLHLSRKTDFAAKGAMERVPTDPDSLRFASIKPEQGRLRLAILRRLTRDQRYAGAIGKAAADFKPDVILSHAPLITQWRLEQWARRNRVPLVYWLQDVASMKMTQKVVARTHGLGRPAGPLIRRFEGRVLRGADRVIAVTPGFLPLLARRGVPSDRITVIPNWAPLDEIKPLARDNPWAVQNGLIGRTVFMYTGTLGMHDDLEPMIELAAALPDTDTVVVATGRGVEPLREEAQRRGLSNLRLFPLQPYERLSEVLATADVLMATLAPDAARTVVPSKILTYLCSRRAVLASMPAENLSSEILVSSGGGIVTQPGDIQEWLAKAKELADDADLRSRVADSGWKYAQETFDIGRIADLFERVFVPELQTHD